MAFTLVTAFIALAGYFIVAGLLGVAPFPSVGHLPAVAAPGFVPYRVGARGLPEGAIPEDYANYFAA